MLTGVSCARSAILNRKTPRKPRKAPARPARGEPRKILRHTSIGCQNAKHTARPS